MIVAAVRLVLAALLAIRACVVPVAAVPVAPVPHVAIPHAIPRAVPSPCVPFVYATRTGNAQSLDTRMRTTVDGTHVAMTVTSTNRHADTGHTHYYFGAVTVVVPAGTHRVRATGAKAKLGGSVIGLTFPHPLSSGESVRMHVTFEAPACQP
jgi:hypothetical protein